MNKGLMIDSDILIDYLRGYMLAVRYMERLKQPLVLSAVTVAELYSGIKDEKEAAALQDFLGVFETVPVTADIAGKASLIHREYARSHGVGLADAIVAATADLVKCPLATLSRKHYPMLRQVVVPYRKN